MSDGCEFVAIYPVFKQAFVTSEHPHGELQYVGDALGRDFMAIKFVQGFSRTYVNDGSRNEDWFSYGLSVHAACDATVERIHINEIENKPGSHTNSRSSSVTFLCESGVRIVYAHLMNISVHPGGSVRRGQPFATCGNNGTSWHPHVHVGAWREQQPLQISVDLVALGEIQREIGDEFYFIPDDMDTKQRFRNSFKK